MSSSDDETIVVSTEQGRTTSERPTRIRRDPDIPSPAQVHGHIPGIKVGATWPSRWECSKSHVHPGIMCGIYGSIKSGAYSIVLNGGYDDDLDFGKKIYYTGSGGREHARGGRQIHNQTFDNKFNKALQVSASTGLPVRVVRGYNLPSAYAPPEGYRYDGLYKVIRAYEEKGREDFIMCRFELIRLPGQGALPYNYQFYNRKKKSKPERAPSMDSESSMSTTTEDRVSVPPDSGNTVASGSSSPSRPRPAKVKRERTSTMDEDVTMRTIKRRRDEDTREFKRQSSESLKPRH